MYNLQEYQHTNIICNLQRSNNIELAISARSLLGKCNKDENTNQSTFTKNARNKKVPRKC